MKQNFLKRIEIKIFLVIVVMIICIIWVVSNFGKNKSNQINNISYSETAKVEEDSKAFKIKEYEKLRRRC